jgi:hypothetical protein
MTGKKNVDIEVMGSEDQLETYEEWFSWEGVEIH